MSEEKFTQGEWHCKDFNSLNQSVQYVRSGTSEICVLYQSVDVNAANAHLISAAPEMYHVLVDLIAEKKANFGDNSCEHLDLILAKARGEQAP